MKTILLTLSGLFLFLNLFSQLKKYVDSEPKGMVFIPDGAYNMKVIDNKDTSHTHVSIEAFWMSNEITNSEYKEYINYIKQHPDSMVCWVNYTNTKKDVKQMLVKCLTYSEILTDIIDSTKFPYKDYFTNKKYDNYPVVGVPLRQAGFYCIWLTLMNNTKLIKLGKPYEHDFRLPTEAEWEYAASKQTSKKTRTTTKNIINPSISGDANDFGLFNMEGNVAEWTASGSQNNISAVDTNTINKDLKIVRGGSWKTSINIYERNALGQNTTEDYIGFRVVRTYLPVKRIDKIKGASLDYVFVSQGSSRIGDSTVTFDSFWISKFEVTNSSYSMFLSDIKQQNDEEDLKIALIHNEKWNLIKFHEPYVEFYSTHLAYKDYPVVNISYSGALLYCKWLTSKLEDKRFEYRLPTKEEWIYAAKGGLDNVDYSCGLYLRGRKGDLLYNYRLIGDEKIHQGINGYQIMEKNYSERAWTTEPSISHEPNAFGLYNMCGNVAEMVMENGIAMGGSWYDTGYDIRIMSEKSYTEPSPMIGFRPVLVRKK